MLRFYVSSKEDAEHIFADARHLGLTGNNTDTGFVWLVTGQALNAHNVPKGNVASNIFKFVKITDLSLNSCSIRWVIPECLPIHCPWDFKALF